MRRTYSREFASLLLAALVAWTGARVYAAADEPPSFVGTRVAQDSLLEALATSKSRQFKPVGRTSVLFRMRTVSRVTAGYKVESHGREQGYRAEIAAYRVSRLLMLDNVPPTIFRQATKQEIRSRFHKEKLARWPGVARATSWQRNGVVDGSASYWIKGAHRGLEERRDDWTSWLRIDGSIPAGKTKLARDLSTMILFDFLVANWDRFSGGNLLMNPEQTRAILVDNDRAFARIDEELYEQLLDDLMNTERFSGEVVDRLVTLDRDAIEEELARDPSHARQPVLADKQVAAILDRRETILSHIAALAEEHGSERVLFFP